MNVLLNIILYLTIFMMGVILGYGVCSEASKYWPCSDTSGETSHSKEAS